MKHLLEAIDNFSRTANQRGHANIVELKHLVAEIREGSDEKNNVQEFYDTLERVVNEIRSMTEHSAAFLQRVRKAEAPNYYDVIKRPMDLGTILKKVKTQQYKNKKSFHDDMTLIWDNCLEYNSYVDHPLRRSANILRQRTDHLLQFVTDLPVRVPRAGSVARDEDAEMDAEGDTDEEADDTDKTRKGTASRKRNYARAGTEDEKPKREPSFLSRDVSMDPDGTETPAEDNRSRSPSILPTNKKRKLLTARTDLLPFEERPALIRTAQGMAEWHSFEASHPIASSSAYTLDDPPPISSTMQRTSSEIRKPLPLAILQLTGKPPVSLPATLLNEDEAPLDVDNQWWEDVAKEEMLVNALPRVPFAASATEERFPEQERNGQSALSNSIRKTIGTMNRIKSINIKLLTASEGLAKGEEVFLGDPNPSASRRHDPPIPLEADPLLYATPLAQNVAHQEMQQVVATLAFHAGFDAFHQVPLHILGSLALGFIRNIGQTIHLLLDEYGHQWTPQEIISQTMTNSAFPSLNVLQEYITDEVKGRSRTLDELYKNLQKTRKDQLAGMLHSKAALDEEEILVEHEGGLLCKHAPALGEDYFKLSNAELHEDHDLTNISIPDRILLGEADERAQNSKQTAPRFSPAPEFVPLTSGDQQEAIESQIGLLQPFLRARQQTEFGLTDDHDVAKKPKVHRPRLLANGRLPMRLRRPAPAAPKRKKSTTSVQTSTAMDVDDPVASGSNV